VKGSVAGTSCGFDDDEGKSEERRYERTNVYE
jgi:hypothetical protein